MPQLPYSTDLEQALLGSVITYRDSLIQANDRNLKAADFYVDAHKTIFNAVKSLYDEGKPVDVKTVINRLSDLKQLDSIGGASYIVRISDMAVSSANSEYYLTQVQEKAMLRRMIEVSSQIREEGYSAVDVPAFIAESESRILEVTRDVKTSDFHTSSEMMRDVIETTKQMESSDGISGVASGFKDLDDMMHGFKRGSLIILAARPSIGKTALALNLALNAAVDDGKCVAFFSFEMGYQELGVRVLSSCAQVKSERIQTGQYLSNNDWASISKARTRIQEADLFIDDNSSTKINDMFAKCRKLKEDKKRLDLVIVDYLQLINPTRHVDNRQQEVSEISRSLKALAREMDVPVIALSQLNREVDRRSAKGEGRPILADLRESGSIEQDADVVMFLHRNDTKKTNKEGEEEEQNKVRSDAALTEIELIIAKHRNGRIGSINLLFQPSVNRFYSKKRDE